MKPQHPRRVLVVDDSSACRAFVRDKMEQAGWLVTEASDGESGAAAALRAPPDVVVADHTLPGLSGTQLCRLLRTDPRTELVPIVIIAGSDSRRKEFWAIESGADVYLSKTDLPQLPELLELVRPPLGAPRARSRVALVDGNSIATRLGHLLDRALFETVLSNRLREATANESTVAGLFARASAIVSRVLPCRWVALCSQDDSAVWVSHRSGLERVAAAEATAALHVDPLASIVTMVDPRCSAAPVGSSVELREVVFGETSLGRFAVSLDRVGGCAEDRATVDVLQRELATALRVVSLVEESRRLALVDPLTGIGNRRAGHDELQRRVAESERHEVALAVAIVDIDHFKQVNDRFGHDAGDLVLKRVADVLSRSVRRSDLVARWGGEEFLVLLPQTDEPGARVVCERIREAIEGERVSLGEGRTHSVTASVGMAAARGPDARQLVLRADEALYRAKHGGRNRVCGAVTGCVRGTSPRVPPASVSATRGALSRDERE